MPPRGYANLTVRRDVLERLEDLRSRLGFGSYSDLLVFLVNTYEEYTRISSKLDELLTRISSMVTRTSSKNSSRRGGEDPKASNSGEHHRGRQRIPDEFYQAFKRWWKVRDQVPFEEFVRQAEEQGFSEEDIYDWSFKLWKAFERKEGGGKGE